LPLTYMLKAYSLDARIASIGAQLIDRVLENPHRNTCDITRNICNIKRNTCNITRVHVRRLHKAQK